MNYLESFKIGWQNYVMKEGFLFSKDYYQIQTVYNTLVEFLKLENFDSTKTNENDYITGLLCAKSEAHFLKILEISELLEFSKVKQVKMRDIFFEKKLINHERLNTFILEIKMLKHFSDLGFITDPNHQYKTKEGNRKPCEIKIKKGNFTAIVEVRKISNNIFIKFNNLNKKIHDFIESKIKSKTLRSESNFICEILFYKTGSSILEKNTKIILKNLEDHFEKFNSIDSENLTSLEVFDDDFKIDIKMNSKNYLVENISENQSKTNTLITLSNLFEGHRPNLSIRSYFKLPNNVYEQQLKSLINKKKEQHKDNKDKLIITFCSETILNTNFNVIQMGISSMKHFLIEYFAKNKLNNYWVFVNHYSISPNKPLLNETYYIIDDKQYFKSVFTDIDDEFIIEVK